MSPDPETIIRTYADRLMHAYPDEAEETALERDELIAGLVQPPDTDNGAERSPAWIVWYEDPDREAEVFSGAGAEDAARLVYAIRLQSWTCHLFMEVGDESGRALTALREDQLETPKP